MNKDNIIQSDSPFDDTQKAVLDALLNLVIPESEDGRMPGAAQVGFAQYVVDVAPAYLAELRSGLDEVIKATPQAFDVMTLEEQESQIQLLRESHERFLTQFTVQVFQCYYQHDNVLTGLGLEARPPFPEGNEVDPGDLSLLDPVRARGEVWRQVSSD